MQNILVTGGLGFIGSNLIELLLLKKYKVINLDKVSYSSNFYNTKDYQKNKNYKFIKCDLNNKNKLNKIIFKHKPIGIFNLAAETHVDRSIDNPESFIQSNIVGVYNLLEYFKIFSKGKLYSVRLTNMCLCSAKYGAINSKRFVLRLSWYSSLCTIVLNL